MLVSLDGPFEACALLLMPPAASRQYLDYVLNGMPSMVMVTGLPTAAIVGAALGASKLSRRTTLAASVAFICGYVVIVPGAAAYMHGEAVGVHFALSLFCNIVIPGFASLFLTSVWLKHKRSRASMQATFLAMYADAESVRGQMPAVSVSPPLPPEPFVLPVSMMPLPLHHMPPGTGHDLNDSDGDMSASASHSSSGDSAHLAQWGPAAFGERR